MALVVQHFEVFKLVVEDGVGFTFDVQRRVGEWFAAELQRHLLVVVAVDVAVATRPDEVAHVQIALLGHHVGEQRVAGDVERHAKKDVRTALVQLATELSFFAWVLRWCHVELEERMAGHERHLVELGHVPCAHDDAAAVGVVFERVNDLLDLVNVASIGGGPAAPLNAVHGTKVAVFAGPFVPNGDVAFFEPVVVAGTCEKPQQLLNDGAQVNLFGGHQWEPFMEVKPHLVAKHALGARASAVCLGNALASHVLHEVFVLAADGAHRDNLVKNSSQFKC